MKIILATDGTKFGDAAAEMLASFKLGAQDHVKIVNVVDMAVPLTIDVYGGYLPESADVETAARSNAEKIVGDACERILTFFPSDPPEITTDILFGSPDSRIVEVAEEWQADIIILGSHGYKRWERLLLGSVSNSVVHHAHCTVMIVRSHGQ